MTRITTGLGLAAALGFAVSLAAQTTTTPPQTTTSSTSSQQTASHGDSAREVTVTGCLARGSDGTFMLNNARTDNKMESSRSSASTTAGGATSTSSTTTGSGATTTGTTGTTGSSSVGTTAAEPSGRSASTGAAMSWKLEGGKDLERHVGHQVQVTGRTESEPKSAPANTGATAPLSSSTAGESGGRRRTLDVQALKMLDASCPEGGDHSR
jgi:hypothetical protein